MTKSEGILVEINRKLKEIIEKIMPDYIINRVIPIYFSRVSIIFSSFKLKKAKKMFDQAPEKPAWLGWQELKALQQIYTFPTKEKYDPKSLKQKGENRAKELIKLIKEDIKKFRTFLELGCYDGMVCDSLNNRNFHAVGIDISTEGFDKRALKNKTKLLEMDARDLKFKDESFDFVFSYDSLEHFSDPDTVLKEAIRVVKTNGYIYFSFGPLYLSPWGAHAFHLISVPYCQFLFSRDLLFKYFESIKGTYNESSINKWLLEDFRKLWGNYSSRLKIMKYYELNLVSYLDLIIKYPSCFKSKTKLFDNLIVRRINVLFKKIG